MIKRAFTEHPASVGESYFQHMGMAFGFGSKMVISGIACLFHGLFPFLFKTTGRQCIEDLHDRMVVHRDRRTCSDMADGLPAVNRSDTSIKPAE